MTRLSKRNLLASITVCLLFASSCKKDFIELLPPTVLTPEQALSTETDLQVAVRGAYVGLRNVDFFGRTVPVLGDLMADNAYQSLTNTNRYTAFNDYSFTVANTDVQNFWRAAYNTILRANNIINSGLAASPNVNQYKGEAYAIRALSYFYLVRFFARPYTDNPDGLGVPIVLQFDAGTVGEQKPARSKVSEVYAQIISDLDQAYNLMTQFTNSTQFSKYAARGLQAKVYLTMGEKANALVAAQDVISNSGFTGVGTSNYSSYWNQLTPRTDKLETLFEVSSDANNSNAFNSLPNIYNQGGYGDLVASDELYNLHAAGDIRRTLYSTVSRGGIPTYAMNGKYPGTNGSEISDTKVLRLSEVYLIAAEASLPASEANALTYLNYITSRRGVNPIASTGTQLFEDIITERRKELAFEGDRYSDLQRLQRDVTRSNNYPAAVRLIPYANFRRVLPIPQSEADANPNIRSQQNPGY